MDDALLVSEAKCKAKVRQFGLEVFGMSLFLTGGMPVLSRWRPGQRRRLARYGWSDVLKDTTY